MSSVSQRSNEGEGGEGCNARFYSPILRAAVQHTGHPMSGKQRSREVSSACCSLLTFQETAEPVKVSWSVRLLEQGEEKT